MKLMCDTLAVSRQGYYGFATRPPSASALRRAELTERIRHAFDGSGALYGSPRITAELRGEGVAVSRNTVARLMRQERLHSVAVRRFRAATTDSSHRYEVADNVLDRRFSQPLPDKAWACDITYVPTGQGFLYVAAVLDLCSRRIVGWSMATHLRASLCLDALEMAVAGRRPGPGLVCHSDRGVQYACDAYRRRLERSGLVASMSRRGDCYDNAPMESFWSSYKRELVLQQPGKMFTTIEQAKSQTFKYIELFYNRTRRHSAIGYLSPEAFEAKLN